jgi:2-polyprenyl-3-methyl-5-hydroxy-6-metoxy-1,4-benzoquinol methylase
MSDLSTAWTAFLEDVRSPSFLEFIARRFGGSLDSAQEQTEHYVEEANHTWALIASQDLVGGRLMEVGCGPGLVSAFLERSGADIYSIEPEDQWFTAVTEYFGLAPARRLETCIESLLPGHAREFDLIFSNNVLEHVEDFQNCVSILSRCLKPGGSMIHNLPNYFIPYEPHFGIPLVPIFPELTRFLIPASMRESALWRSLNFASVWQLARIAKSSGASLTLRRGTMGASFERLLKDSPYTARHSLLAPVGGLLKAAGLLRLIDKFPPHLSTPMVFEWRV